MEKILMKVGSKKMKVNTKVLRNKIEKLNKVKYTNKYEIN